MVQLLRIALDRILALRLAGVPLSEELPPDRIVPAGDRRAELAGIRVRDFDAQRGWLRVFGRGRKERLLP